MPRFMAQVNVSYSMAHTTQENI